jgi:hypothetical protein
MPCSRPTDTASWEGDRVNVFDYAEREAYLTNSMMAEAADKLCSIGSHFHSTHGLHLLVHGQQLILGDLNLQVRFVTTVSAERVS